MQLVSKIWPALALLAVLLPVLAQTQDAVPSDSNDVPLGDVARNLRKKTPTSQAVIDDDNVERVLERAESQHAPGASLKYVMEGETKNFQISAPEATCSLSFSANAKALLSSQYAQMDLPPGEMLKLKGPATIEGDALNVSVFNGTNWHVSEVAVALTVVRKGGIPDGLSNAGPDVPAVDPLAAVGRAEKRPDQTVIYRMRAAAAPTATTVFSTPLDLDMTPGDEWHWAIVQAKGYPPETYSLSAATALATADDPVPAKPPTPVIPVSLQDAPAADFRQPPR